MTLFPFRYLANVNTNLIQNYLNALLEHVTSNKYDRQYVQNKFIDPILRTLVNIDDELKENEEKAWMYDELSD